MVFDLSKAFLITLNLLFEAFWRTFFASGVSSNARAMAAPSRKTAKEYSAQERDSRVGTAVAKSLITGKDVSWILLSGISSQVVQQQVFQHTGFVFCKSCQDTGAYLFAGIINE
jgi:hypothetical protein